MSEQNLKEQGSVCCSCGLRQVFPTEIEYRTKIVLDRREHEVSVSNLPVRQCRDCHEVYFGNRADRAIDDALRMAAGLLTAPEIREARETLGVESQQELAELIGVAPESLSRWMKGHVVQSRLADTVLRVFFAVPEARSFLRSLRRDGVGGQPIVVADRSASIRHNFHWAENEGSVTKSHGVRPANGTGLAA